MSESVDTADSISSHNTEKSQIAEHPTPELSESDLEPALATARVLFEEKMDKYFEYLDTKLSGKFQKSAKKEAITMLYAFCEKCVLEPEKIEFINFFETERGEDLKCSMYIRDFELMSDLILDDVGYDFDGYCKEMEEDESESGMHGVLLPVSAEGEEDDNDDDEEEEEEEEGYQGTGIPLIHGTSPSLESDHGLEPIEEGDEDEGPVFL
ncbi:hypothetical protein E2P81_ATG01137 [Venturia nashicola]|nr:hypothetical protein E2P81_ATG01137 [Venturia nashicola]